MKARTRMLVGLLVVAVGASALTAGVLAGRGGAGQAEPGRNALSRVERVFNRPWSSFCDFDFCAISRLFEIPVRTPADTARVDVTLTMTLEYRTTPGTAASAGAGFQAGSSTTRMDPRGGFRLAPSSQSPTTATLTWVKRGVPAAGRTHTFSAGVSLRSLTGDDTISVRGRKLSVVIETWSAGS
jgi:hypothetical protein